MVFKRDPVVSPGNQIISFANKVITLASYSENNGDAELDVAATEPLMATFNSDRRTITVSPVPRRRRQVPLDNKIRRRPHRRQTASQASVMSIALWPSSIPRTAVTSAVRP